MTTGQAKGASRFSHFALAAMWGLGACAIFQPTASRPVVAPGLTAEITSIRGAAAEAVVSFHAEQTELVGPAWLSPADGQPCLSRIQLELSRKSEGQVAGQDVEMVESSPRFKISGNDVLSVDLPGGGATAHRGLFVDIDRGSSEGPKCLRLPLTPVGDEILWRATGRPWSLGWHTRFAYPFASLGGIGVAWTAGVQAIHQLGPVRAFVGFTLGLASCRRDCPGLSYSSDGANQPSGVFRLAGVDGGLGRRFAIGRWSIAITAGGAATAFDLAAQDDFTGDRRGALVGPYAALHLIGPGGAALPGFFPAPRPVGGGPEFRVMRQTAHGRGPTETAWILSLGWGWEKTL